MVVGETLVAHGVKKSDICARGWGMSVSEPNDWPRSAETIRAELYFSLEGAEFPVRPEYYGCITCPDPIAGFEGGGSRDLQSDEEDEGGEGEEAAVLPSPRQTLHNGFLSRIRGWVHRIFSRFRRFIPRRFIPRLFRDI